MSADDTFTYSELRITLTAFAIWAGLVDSAGASEAVKLVDRFIAETVTDSESDWRRKERENIQRLKLVDP
jgi:hypothetical protein